MAVLQSPPDMVQGCLISGAPLAFHFRRKVAFLWVMVRTRLSLVPALPVDSFGVNHPIDARLVTRTRILILHMSAKRSDMV